VLMGEWKEGKAVQADVGRFCPMRWGKDISGEIR